MRDIQPSTNEAEVEPDVLVEVEAEELVEEDLMVNDVSIDGMCGVY